MSICGYADMQICRERGEAKQRERVGRIESRQEREAS